MIRKLDKLVIKAFFGPFAATFFITLLVLVLQFFWLWIDDFVGKGLSTGVILEFIMYQSAALVPLALPLAVLLSSLITFGNLGETYELVAVKASGISLLRFMRPLLILVTFVSGIAFYFGNNVIPVAIFKSHTLLYDIVNSKPAFDIKEGVFYDKINGFSIKVGKKVGDSIIKDVVIYEQGSGLQDNFIVATDGIMRTSDDKRFLEFILKNGYRYQEKGTLGTASTEFVRLGFQEYKKRLDLASFQFQRSDTVKSNSRILTMKQLNVVIDSMKKSVQPEKRVQTQVFSDAGFVGYADSNWNKIQDTGLAYKNIDEMIPDSVEVLVKQRAQNKINIWKANLEVFNSQFAGERKELRQNQIEWHRKITLPLACIVLFLIGAPLGAIIRKGGLGNSLIAAIGFFMVFYFIANTGEKVAREGSWSVVTGMWLATFVLLPVGLFLTYKAVRDSQLFNKEYYFRIWRKFRAKRG